MHGSTVFSTVQFWKGQVDEQLIKILVRGITLVERISKDSTLG